VLLQVAARDRVHGTHIVARLRRGTRAMDDPDRLACQVPDHWPPLVANATDPCPGESWAEDRSPLLVHGQRPGAHPLQQTAAGQVV
jgi:hypothetical protein